MTAFETIVASLRAAGVDVKLTKGGARAQCPVHNSRGLTLSVRRGDGRVSVYCFAGCEDVEVLDALGLVVRDLFDEPRTDRTYAPPPTRTPWEQALKDAGLHDGPSLDHLLARMLTEQAKERNAGGSGDAA
ncbi:hypothetical protein KLP28_01765 [Nocardioidaceae bacterium]|nr:hypothetical protein KLP28_01765 [Nocardioidaceae bacterium]